MSSHGIGKVLGGDNRHAKFLRRYAFQGGGEAVDGAPVTYTRAAFDLANVETNAEAGFLVTFTELRCPHLLERVRLQNLTFLCFASGEQNAQKAAEIVDSRI